MITNIEAIKIVNWLEYRWIKAKNRQRTPISVPSQKMCKLSSVFILLLLQRKYYPYYCGWQLRGGFGASYIQLPDDLKVLEDGGYNFNGKWIDHFWIQNNKTILDLTCDQFHPNKRMEYIINSNSTNFNLYYKDTASNFAKRNMLKKLRNDRLINKWIREALDENLIL